MTVLAIPSEQLRYITTERCLRRQQDNYETAFAYNTNYIFRTERAAWDFLMDKDVHYTLYVTRQELWPNKRIKANPKERKILKYYDKLRD